MRLCATVRIGNGPVEKTVSLELLFSFFFHLVSHHQNDDSYQPSCDPTNGPAKYPSDKYAK